MDVVWKTQRLDQLSASQLFEILSLRQAIFVVEQRCAYPDIDAADKKAWHFSAYIDDQLAACARLIPPGVTYKQASIGRVAVRESWRGSGLGRTLMEHSIAKTQELFPGETLKIGAQHRLEEFYLSLGFSTVSEPYLEDGIAHIDMLMPSATV